MDRSRRLRGPAGITLLEVLVSIGILAIGLTSVLSLIPLGRSLLAKTVAYDQSGTLLDNAHATVLTLGLANVDALTGTAGGPCPDSPIVIDPLGISAGDWPAASGLNPAVLRAGATLTGTAPASVGPRSWPVSGMLFSSGDDVLVSTPDNDDSPVTNRFSQGVRQTAGRTTWLAVLAKSSGTTPFVAGELATLSIVVCRNRVPGLMPPAPGTSPIQVTLQGPPYVLRWPTGAQIFPDRENREVARKGAILLVVPSQDADAYRAPKFLTLAAATLLPTADGAEVTFEGNPSLELADGSPPLPVLILPDATAVREFTATIEGFNEFTR